MWRGIGSRARKFDILSESVYNMDKVARGLTVLGARGYFPFNVGAFHARPL